jgi:hypothetical protein
VTYSPKDSIRIKTGSCLASSVLFRLRIYAARDTHQACATAREHSHLSALVPVNQLHAALAWLDRSCASASRALYAEVGCDDKYQLDTLKEVKHGPVNRGVCVHAARHPPIQRPKWKRFQCIMTAGAHVAETTICVAAGLDPNASTARVRQRNTRKGPTDGFLFNLSLPARAPTCDGLSRRPHVKALPLCVSMSRPSSIVGSVAQHET